MDAIDNHYFSELETNYDWEKYLISLKCEAGELNILDTSKPLTKEGEKNASFFIHEYIHYLQNFSSTWGITIFADFAFALIEIGASSSDNKDVLNIPLTNEIIDNNLLSKGIQRRKDVINKVNPNNEFEREDGERLKYKLINSKQDYLTISNSRITVPIRGKAIREHMAHLGTLLFLGKDDTKIHEYTETFNGFKYGELTFANQPEYWIIFEYYFSLEKFSQLAKGIFFLMQQCLATNTPENILKRFNDWILTKEFAPATLTCFHELVVEWIAEDNIEAIFETDLKDSKLYCLNIQNKAEPHMHQNDLLKFTHNILGYIVENIESTSGGRTLYLYDDNFYGLNYWNYKVNQYGSGIVRYLDQTMIHGSLEHCKKMEDSFLFLISSSYVLNKVLRLQRPECPFLDEMPICKASYRGESNCSQNPFEMIKNELHGKECTFANGVLLLGFQNRIKFN